MNVIIEMLNYCAQRVYYNEFDMDYLEDGHNPESLTRHLRSYKERLI